MLRRAFLVAAIGWAAALPVAAWVAARPTASPLYAFAFSMYAVGSLICHQLPERSFHLWSAQMPVCARCTGIYAGGAIAAIVSYALYVASRFSATVNRTKSRLKVDVTSGRNILLLAALPTVATLLFEWTTGQMPANWIRALAGSAIGAAVVWVIASDIN